MLKEYIYDNKFQLLVVDNTINILNYEELISFSDIKVIIKCKNNNLTINGKNLIINKMIYNELLIKGVITSIEFR